MLPSITCQIKHHAAEVETSVLQDKLKLSIKQFVKAIHFLCIFYIHVLAQESILQSSKYQAFK